MISPITPSPHRLERWAAAAASAAAAARSDLRPAPRGARPRGAAPGPTSCAPWRRFPWGEPQMDGET